MSVRVMLMAAAFAAVSAVFSFKTTAEDVSSTASPLSSPQYFDIHSDAAPGHAPANPATTPSESPTTAESAPAEAASTPQRPLMMLLDKAGAAQTLNNARINLYGWIEGSYTYSP